MVHSRDNELGDTTDAHSYHEEDSSTSDFGDNAAVYDDDDDADGSQDAGVLERVSNSGHFEEECAIRNHKHCSGRSLDGNSCHRQQCSASVDGVLEDVDERSAAGEFFLGSDRSLDFLELFINSLGMGTHPDETLFRFRVFLDEDEPARGLGDEEEADGHQHWDDVDDAQGDKIAVLPVDAVRCVVNHCADERTDRGPGLENRNHKAAVASWCAFLYSCGQ